jgi:DNA-binding SARP family transcriptional activator
METYNRVLRQDDGHVGALTALAEMYEIDQEFDQAEVALLRIVRSHPSVAYHLYTLGKFYERHGQSRKAKRAFSKADSIAPRQTRKMRRLK